MTTRTRAVSFCLDSDLQSTVEKWLEEHPGFSMSRLVNLAIRGYVSKDQILEAVETVPATKEEVESSLMKLMKKHKKTLDELK
jgi:hypothetical protein